MWHMSVIALAAMLWAVPLHGAQAEVAPETLRLAQAGGGYLGIVVADITAESGPALGVPGNRGALVIGLEPGMPAALAGLRPGDAIVALADRPITRANDLLTVSGILPGRRVTVTVMRNGQRRSLVLVPADVTASASDGYQERLEFGAYANAVAAYERGDAVTSRIEAERLAEAGHPEAQNLLGMFCEIGWGGPVEFRRAALWYRLAASQGVPAGQYNLGLLYQQGAGVPRDNARAYFWFAEAAARNHPESIALRDQLGAALTPRERAALRLLGAAPADGVPAVQPAQTPAEPQPEIRTAQELLRQLGYDPGAADGLMGRRTRAAIEAFQAARGLPVDGRVTPALTAALTQAVAEAAPLSGSVAAPAVPPPETPTPPAPTETPTGSPPAEDDLGDLGFPADQRLEPRP